jgi:hypothetical protein
MPETNDELLERLAYQRGAVWTWATRSPPSESWDHDHCVVCWARFATLDTPGEELLREGFATTGPRAAEVPLALLGLLPSPP